MTAIAITCAARQPGTSAAPDNARTAPPAPPADSPSPAPPPDKAAPTPGLDMSDFLSSKTGFLPLALPITEPAVGYGLVLGLSFFHSEPKLIAGPEGGRTRILMPSTTVVLGAATENGT